MTVMNFDLEDGLPVVSFTMKPDDAGRFVRFMAECEETRTSLAHWKVFGEHAEGERSRLQGKVARLSHNESVLMNALWKACGDDEEMVRQIIESQGALQCEPEQMKG